MEDAVSQYPVVTPWALRARGYPMATSADLIRMQQQQNDIAAFKRDAEQLRNLTLRRFWQDIGNAIDGCMHDVLVERSVSLKDAFAGPARLRGFGFLLIVIGLGGLLSCLVLGFRTSARY